MILGVCETLKSPLATQSDFWTPLHISYMLELMLQRVLRKEQINALGIIFDEAKFS